MLSLAPHQYAHFGQMPPEMRSPFPDPPRSCGNQRIQTSNLEPLDTSVPFASPAPSPLSNTGRRSLGPMAKHNPRNRHAPYDTSKRGFKSDDARSGTESATESRSTSGPVRRRISRACDQCNQLRTKCDGMNPCAHCIGMKMPNSFALTC
jgi:xylanolytic transcriptional activator XlnR